MNARLRCEACETVTVHELYRGRTTCLPCSEVTA